MFNYPIIHKTTCNLLATNILEGVPYLNSNQDFLSQPFIDKALIT